MMRTKAEEETRGDRVRVKLREEPDREAVMTAELPTETVEAVAEKVAEVAPARTVIEAGTDKTALLFERATTAPPVGAARFNVTVQVAEVLELRVVGLQVRLAGTVGVSKDTEKLTEEPDREAVMTAVLSAVIVEAVAEKVAEVAPAATVTEVGIVSRALFLERVTVVPPAGAGLLTVTVQLLLAPEVREAGLQLRFVSRVGATRLREKVAELPAGEAVMVAVLSVMTEGAEAEKIAEVDPAGIVTEEGTTKAVLLLDRGTTVPPAGAGWVVVKVQELTPPEVKVVGLQLREAAGVISIALILGLSMTGTS